ncbi:hypothetical protein EVAR_12378_1 [Eumeta japonica]|uniref:Uncharacterized protein n=1 Tax=Eumeta variegata TaxID=151549 RepID=A0A4C1TZA8_EUMVA|nr:hypothetical protein EVAR_12378_1 [Eumeta japonica]
MEQRTTGGCMHAYVTPVSRWARALFAQRVKAAGFDVNCDAIFGRPSGVNLRATRQGRAAEWPFDSPPLFIL